MTPLVPIALFGWIPVVLLLFAALPPRRAVLAGFFLAWMFLPMAGYRITGLPDYTKVSATCVGVLLGILLFDGGRIFTFRPKLVDVPIVVWCLLPLPSAIAGGYGVYEGLSLALSRTVSWGIPFLVGRLYFGNLTGVRELAIAMVLGGLVYVPLCLYEIRMSPQLHRIVYGYHQHMFLQAYREGGWRPTVFMQHGLAVGTFMCTAALVGFWVWRTRSVRALGGVPMVWLVPPLIVTAYLVKSTGATALALAGGVLLVAIRVLRSSVARTAMVLMLVAAPGAYVAARTVLGWDGRQIVQLAETLFGATRADSIAFRLVSEDNMWALAQPHLLLGQGRFNFDYRTPDGAIGVVPDGYWIIALGCNGVVGLAAFFAVMALPVLRFTLRTKAWMWWHPGVAPAAVVAVAIALYAVDCVFNAMENPIFFLAIGGMAALRLTVETAAQHQPTPAMRAIPRGAPA